MRHPLAFADIELVSDTVTLQPLMSNHANELVQLAASSNMSSLWFTQVPNSNTIDSYMATAMAQESSPPQKTL